MSDIYKKDIAPEMEGRSKLVLAVSATFTAEPIEETLSFWFNRLQMPTELAFAPYNQVFQQLLDPTSLIGNNTAGINLLLVRFEDWASDSTLNQTDNLYNFINGVKKLDDRNTSPTIICICPPSASDQTIANNQQFEAILTQELAAFSNIHLILLDALFEYYLVDQVDNPYSDQVGHIPYSPEFFTAIGTMVVRKIFALQQKPAKVIVLDCDNTLWQGVCGEDGPTGIQITEPYHYFQKFLIKQSQAGMLLCLCSKNSEEDVFAVFDTRTDMPLQRKQLVSWRINWQTKSQNIRALADELQLGLDSFIFIDDNPVECGEVRANCPEVLTLQLPEDTALIPTFINHVWAFDRLKVTAEDQKRTLLYQQNVQREQLRGETSTFQDFLTGLDLQTEFTMLNRHQLPRVSQLTQRTNQFNLSTIRRSESELERLCLSGDHACLTIEVQDRFGDYGLVGVVIFAPIDNNLQVDTFLLSCRVLGRGVEHQIIARLGQIAVEQGLSTVILDYHQTERNEPILKFLKIVGQPYMAEIPAGFLFSIPTDIAQACNVLNTIEETKTISAADQTDNNTRQPIVKPNIPQTQQAILNEIALELYGVEPIAAAMSRVTQPRPNLDETFVPPQTPTEKTVAQIWADILRLEQVGIHDQFVNLGGGSLQLVQVHSKLQQALSTQIPVTTLFTLPTVNAIVQYLTEKKSVESISMAVNRRALKQAQALNRTRLLRSRK